MSVRLDSLSWEVLVVLMQTPERRLQRRDIRDEVFQKYEKKYGKDTFEVILQRTLNRLLVSGYLKRDNVGHQQVYYFIPKKRQIEIAGKLEKRLAHELFDDMWDALTPEQRKKLVVAMKQHYDKMIQVMNRIVHRFTKKLENGIIDLAKLWMSNLEHPSEHIKRRFSPEQRQGFLESLCQIVDGTLKRFQENCTRCVHYDLDEDWVGRCRVFKCDLTDVETLKETDTTIFTSGCKNFKKNYTFDQR